MKMTLTAIRVSVVSHARSADSFIPWLQPGLLKPFSLNKRMAV